MEERLAAHADHMEGVFNAHTKDEMERYDSILRLIERNNEENKHRHESLMSAVSDAFPLDGKGKPDFRGHALAHESMIQSAADARAMFSYMKRLVLGAATVAAGSWALLVLWQGFLRGPGQ